MRYAMRTLKMTALVLVLAVALGFGGTQPVAAEDCSKTVDSLGCICDNAQAQSESSVCSTDPTKDPLTGNDGVLKKVSVILALLGGVVAVILILIGGIQYVLAAGDAQKAANARQMILGAVIGLVIIAVAYGLIVTVVSRIL